MGTVPSPAATVAIRILRALGIDDRERATLALITWSRPSPPLSPADIRAVLSAVDDSEPPPVPPHVQGIPLGNRHEEEQP